MAFFQKLKDRLFKSSAKIEGGLDAIVEETAAEPSNASATAPSEAPPPSPRPGLAARLTGAEAGRVLDDAMLESLEELLISADMGVETALRVTANIAEGRFGRRIGAQALKELLAAEIAAILGPVARPMPLTRHRPQVVLVVGVNGSGKTTTIGKLASQFRAAGKTVIIAAGDTFRAAAVEQLGVWADRLGVQVVKGAQGGDPAAVAFDAAAAALARGVDVLILDTAGRLHTQKPLMDQLSKIRRVVEKKIPGAPHEVLLVVDATTGQNGVNQAKVFSEATEVTGIFLSKLDGSAKGGIVVAIREALNLPVKFVGLGETPEDVAAFDPEAFVEALFS